MRPRALNCKHSTPACAACEARREYSRRYMRELREGKRELVRRPEFGRYIPDAAW